MTNKNDLRWYLFEEFQQTCAQEGLNSHQLILTDLEKHSKIFNNLLIKFILTGLRTDYGLFSHLYPKNNEKTILFQNMVARYPSIIDKSSKMNAILLGVKPRVLKDLLSRKVRYYPIFDNVFADLYSGIISDDTEKLDRSICKLTEIFQYLKPNIVVLNEDHLPSSRAIILVSKMLDIPTVAIQDGIYQSDSLLPSGKYCDYMFVWGDYFKDLLLKKGITTSDKIKVLGYPYELKNSLNLKEVKKKTIYYLGQNFEEYNPKLLNTKLNTIKSLNDICNGLKLDFIYRPHPHDNLSLLKKKLPNVKFSSPREKLLDSFKKGTIFISFNSTSLIEAALHSKICIQLKNYPTKSDNFEKLGICPTFYDLDEIKIYLKNLSKKNSIMSLERWEIDSKYIEIPKPDPGTKFLELLNDIL